MTDFNALEVWFVTGSQHLYGPAVLQQVAADARQIVTGLNQSTALPIKVVFKPVLTTPDAITDLCLEANRAANALGWSPGCTRFRPPRCGLRV